MRYKKYKRLKDSKGNHLEQKVFIMILTCTELKYTRDLIYMDDERKTFWFPHEIKEIREKIVTLKTILTENKRIKVIAKDNTIKSD